MKHLILLAMGCCMALGAFAQREVEQTADSIVKYQLKSGGWPKNQKWLQGVDAQEAKEWVKTGVGSTIDNGATTSEMETLAKALTYLDKVVAVAPPQLDKKLIEEKRARYNLSFNLGLEYLLKMQYDNGGFPQFYPKKKKADYSTHITFNDNAMVNVLRMLRDVAQADERFKAVAIEKGMRKKCQEAYERGLACVLNCQIRVDGTGRVVDFGSPAWKSATRTVWCQQHDEKTLAPTNARAYELASFSGFGETCKIVELLMEVRQPSAEIRGAVVDAIEWLKAHAIHDHAIEHYQDANGEDDIRLVEKNDAPLLWARFYDLNSGQPFYCDRDGVSRTDLEAISKERRMGYSWISDAPRKTIEKYEQWLQQ